MAAEEARGKKRKATAPEGGRRFETELRSMMYGFGDDRQPLTSSVHLMEGLVVDYVYQLLLHAQTACKHRLRGARGSGSARISERDLLHALRRNPQKQHRVAELLEVWKEVKAARGSTLKELEDDVD